MNVSRHFNPSTVIATVALFAALGTSAASALPGKGTIDRNDIQANAVKAKQVKDASLSGAEVIDGTIGSGDIADGSVGGSDIADDTVAGSDVNEASLGKVGQAANADRVAGLTMRAHTGIVDLPSFAAGQNVCKSTQVDVPGVGTKDHVLMTSDGIPTYVGEDQVVLTVHSVGNGEVEVQGCISASTTAQINPTPSGYVFLVIEK